MIKVRHLQHCPVGFPFTHQGTSYELHQWYPEGNFLYTTDHIEFLGDEEVLIDPEKYEKIIIGVVQALIPRATSVFKLKFDCGSNPVSVTLDHYHPTMSCPIGADPRPWEEEYQIQINLENKNEKQTARSE